MINKVKTLSFGTKNYYIEPDDPYVVIIENIFFKFFLNRRVSGWDISLQIGNSSKEILEIEYDDPQEILNMLETELYNVKNNLNSLFTAIEFNEIRRY